MADNTQATTDTDIKDTPILDTPVTTPDVPPNTEDNSVLRSLRKELAKTKQQLETIKKADEDKTKSIEEKLAEATARASTLEQERQSDVRKYQLEKELIKSKVNNEFLDLMLSKGGNEDDIETVVSELKTQYPSAFTKEEIKAQPIGKTGVSVTNSQTPNVLTKELALELLSQPSNANYKQYSSQELLKALNS